MKISHFIFLACITFINQSTSSAKVINTQYTMSLNILGADIKIGQINSVSIIHSDKYELSFKLESEKLISFISPIYGNGSVNGLVDSLKLMPINYEYDYSKKNKNKNTKILFNNSEVVKSKTLPTFNKNKLTPISDIMLKDVIDPVTAIIYMGNHDFNNGCSKNYKIYDGKRRYDLKYIDKFEEDGYLVCKLRQYKIGGFKLNDNEVDAFKPAQEIVTYFEIIDDQYTLRKIVTKSKFAKIRIDLIYL